ncbi:MAG: CDP-alcohol phosphatidyltransferase family protein [Planctomycetota bacterium]
MRRLLPNAVTVLRLALLLVFAWAVLGARPLLATALLAAIGLSDWLDGFLARRWRAESRLGALLDPIADKLTQVTGLLLLAVTSSPVFTPIPAPFVALVFGRDLLLLYGALRVRLRRGTIRIRPRWEGRASTVLGFALLLAACLGLPRAVVVGLCVAAAPLVVAAGVRYTLDGHRQISEPARSAP